MKKLAFYLDKWQLVVENWEKLQKVPFFKNNFLQHSPLGDQNNGPTIQEQDVLAVDQLSKRYEEQSGALLSRNSKSKEVF